MFELSQLRCFVAVAEDLHFSKAAERLNMTQPPVSRQIRLLEHVVGAMLLDRSSRVVKLTAAGKSFLPEAQRILRLAEEAATTARRVARGETGTLSIGFTAAIGYHLLPQIVQRLRKAMPHVALTLKEMVSNAQLEALVARQIDIGLLRPHAQQSEVETISLAHEALMLAVPEHEAADWPEHPTLKSLNKRPFLMYSPYEARYFYQLLQGLLEQAQVQPDVVEHVSQIHTMMALVNSGIGAALIPESAAQLGFRGLVLRKMATKPPKPVQMVLSCRRDNPNPVLQVFKATVLGSMLK